ncbi:hypothetical protein HK101_004627 [Irineochytrium annulatum]|nr:hypothetical protein HK101_004627 [Irineochytrium annulatum]
MCFFCDHPFGDDIDYSGEDSDPYGDYYGDEYGGQDYYDSEDDIAAFADAYGGYAPGLFSMLQAMPRESRCVFCGGPTCVIPTVVSDGHGAVKDWDSFFTTDVQVLPLDTEGPSPPGVAKAHNPGYFTCGGKVYDCALRNDPGAVPAHTACVVVAAHAMARRGITGWRSLARWLVYRGAGKIGGGGKVGLISNFMYAPWARENAHPLVLPPLRLIEGETLNLPAVGRKVEGHDLAAGMKEYLRLDEELSKRLGEKAAGRYPGDGVRRVKNYPRVYPVTSYAPNAAKALPPRYTKGVGTLSHLPLELIQTILMYFDARSLVKFEGTCRAAYDIIRSPRSSTLWRQRCAERGWVAKGPDCVWRAPHCPHLPSSSVIRWREYYRECDGHQGAKNLEIIEKQVGRILDMYQTDTDWPGVEGGEVELTIPAPMDVDGQAVGDGEEGDGGVSGAKVTEALSFDDGSAEDLRDVIKAIKLGYTSASDHFLARGGGVDATDTKCESLLYAAVVTGAVDLIRKLRDIGARFDGEYVGGHNILTVAASHGQASALEVLLPILDGRISGWAKSPSGSTPLEVACGLRSSASVMAVAGVLFKMEGMEEEKLAALIVSCLQARQNWSFVLRALPADTDLLQRTDESGWTVLGHAVLAVRRTQDVGPLRGLKELAECRVPGAKGMAVPSINLTGFHLAILRDEMMAASWLAAPDNVNLSITIPDLTCLSPDLNFAVAFAGLPPAHTAATLCRLRAIELLHRVGANFTARTPSGQTALHLACLATPRHVDGLPIPTVTPRNVDFTSMPADSPQGLSPSRLWTGKFAKLLGARTVNGWEGDSVLVNMLLGQGCKVRYKNGKFLKRVKLPEGELRELFGGKKEVEVSRLRDPCELGMKKLTECGAPEVIELLVALCGVDVNAVDAMGRTALDLVEGGKKVEDWSRRVDVLKTLGGKRAIEL